MASIFWYYEQCPKCGETLFPGASPTTSQLFASYSSQMLSSPLFIYFFRPEAEIGDQFSEIKIIKLWDNSKKKFNGVKVMYFFYYGESVIF